MSRTVRIGVGVGGTFTDLLLHNPRRGLTWPGKLPTTPRAPHEAITAGIARLLEETSTAPKDVAGIVHGTTLVTNTLLERTGIVVGLLITSGFSDSLEMGRETRSCSFGPKCRIRVTDDLTLVAEIDPA
jgi:N-methylhydantoinase A